MGLSHCWHGEMVQKNESSLFFLVFKWDHTWQNYSVSQLSGFCCVLRLVCLSLKHNFKTGDVLHFKYIVNTDPDLKIMFIQYILLICSNSMLSMY